MKFLYRNDRKSKYYNYFQLSKKYNLDFEYKYLFINDKEHKTLYVSDRKSLRKWLKKNHLSEKEIWLIYFKKHTGKDRVAYNDAVEEAICFGWIDSTVKRIDHERYMQKFTVRNKKSKWSELNKTRALKLIKEGKMAAFGNEKIKNAKETGSWNNTYGKKTKQIIPKDLAKALSNNDIANKNFNNFAPGYQNSYIFYINDAKREDTRKRRIQKVVERASKNIKPGMM